jgi:hypothetical protein
MSGQFTPLFLCVTAGREDARLARGLSLGLAVSRQVEADGLLLVVVTGWLGRQADQDTAIILQPVDSSSKQSLV